MDEVIEAISRDTEIVGPLAAPAWARAVTTAAPETCALSGDITLLIRSTTDATLVSASAPGARIMHAEAFRSTVERVYAAVRSNVNATAAVHVVRMWNHIPGIHDVMDDDPDGVDRYMVFNAGRHAAMSRWYGAGDATTLATCAPAASGVGHDGDALVVHALALAAPGQPVENPDQVPAYHYSRKYGPVPPCFARATRLNNGLLLISGTAAITGENTRFDGDLPNQFALTLRHLRTLIGPGPCAGDPLARLQHARVYVPRAGDRIKIQRLCDDAFACPVEFCAADLCRKDLLVEIEAVAKL
jgi:chorismate lyase/3-hydroxybenzoate synthase